MEARNDFWSISEKYIYRSHVEPRVKLYVPREASFPIPLKYIDMTRATSTPLDVMPEKSIDDYWNVDGDGDLSDTWTGFTRFTTLDEKPPDGYTWSGERLTRKQTTSRPDSLWPEIWKDMSEAAQRKKKNKGGLSKNRSFTMQEDCAVFTSLIRRVRSSKKLFKKRGGKFEVPMTAAMPCKIRGRMYKEIVEILMFPDKIRMHR